MVGQEAVDARRAGHVHSNAVPIPLLCQVSKGVPRDSERPLPGPGLRRPPRASLGGDRATSTSHLLSGYPGHCAVVSPYCPAVPRSPAAVVAGSGWLTLRDRKTKSGSGSATCSSRTAGVPERSTRAGAPAGREGRQRLRLRSGAERFLRNLPPSSSLL